MWFESGAGSKRVAERADPDELIGFADVEGADGRVAHVHAGLSRQGAGVVYELAIAGNERDLLERDEVGIQRSQKEADRPERMFQLTTRSVGATRSGYALPSAAPHVNFTDPEAVEGVRC